jgi:hypothetical protein
LHPLRATIATLATPLMQFWMRSLRALIGGALVMGAVIFDIAAENRARSATGLREAAIPFVEPAEPCRAGERQEG